MTRHDETNALKVALKAAGLKPTRVKHGTGTASGWLKVKLHVGGEHIAPAEGLRYCIGEANGCQTCKDEESAIRLAYGVIREVTGRSDYAMERVGVYTN